MFEVIEPDVLFVGIFLFSFLRSLSLAGVRVFLGRKVSSICARVMFSILRSSCSFGSPQFRGGISPKDGRVSSQLIFFPGREKDSQSSIIDTPTHLKNNSGAEPTEKKAW